MIKLTILNLCMSFQVTGVNSLTFQEAAYLQKAAFECKEEYQKRGCIDLLTITRSEKSFKAKYRCIDGDSNE